MSGKKTEGRLNRAASNEFYERLGKNMALARIQCGNKSITMDELAEECGYRRAYLYQAEHGKTIVDPYVLAQYSRITGADFNFLFHDTIDCEPSSDESSFHFASPDTEESLKILQEHISKLEDDLDTVKRLLAYLTKISKK